jgi:hypothetical protein
MSFIIETRELFSKQMLNSQFFLHGFSFFSCVATDASCHGAHVKSRLSLQTVASLTEFTAIKGMEKKSRRALLLTPSKSMTNCHRRIAHVHIAHQLRIRQSE